MIASIRAELRKLLTVRSTYLIFLGCLAIIVLFAGYGDGIRASAASLRNPNQLAQESYSAILFVGLIIALVGLLSFGHEYRYNGIMYTLTASNNRLKSLAAKAIVVTIFAVITSVIFALFSPLCNILAIHFSGKRLGPQSFDVWDVLWHCVFVGWGYAMYAFILVAIIRSQVGAIVMFLLIPLIGETILAAVFKDLGKYLPFTSLQSVTPGSLVALPANLAHYVTVSLIYIGGGLLVSAVLFARRDAN
ncbi:ABC transporter permease [Aeromicrobium sp.]|nr:ABC transporter permease [Candidatus Saccharibacteria bacterium]